jgi:hypothetical protein
MRYEPDYAERDRGSVLVLALVMAVTLSVVIAAVASYVTSGLTYGRVVEERADRLAAADGGLRYAIESLSNSKYAGCLTNLGNTGYTIDFPVKINGADTTVTCTKGANGIGDIRAWAIIVTGQGVPPGQWMLQSQAGGGVQKLLGGPVWISDPGRTDLSAPVKIEDGDVWYYRPDCKNPGLTVDPDLTFTPAYRGTICVDKPWDYVYSAPPVGAFAAAGDVANTDPPSQLDAHGCTVFSPGRYTVAPSFGTNNYMKSGNYYFDNVKVDVTNAVVTAGWADWPNYNDSQFIANYPCADATNADMGSGSASGATWYMGGGSKIEIGNKGSLEIMRRLQGDDIVSIQAMCLPGVDTGCPASAASSNWSPSTLGFNDNLIVTQSGNNSDLAIHGLVWAPKAQMEFGNVTNSANGQLLGGAALARIVLQASASASAFVIRVPSSPVAFEVKVDATATKNGVSTTMRAIVQLDIEGKAAVNSIRVLGI